MIPINTRYPNTFLRFTFYLFALSLPLDAINLGIENVSFTKVTGFVLALGALQQLSIFRNRIPKAFAWFLVYVIVAAGFGFLWAPECARLIVSRLLTFIQLGILTWIAYGLMLHRQVAHVAMLSLAVSCTLLASLQLCGVFASIDEQTGRVSVFEEDPNFLSLLFTIGMLPLLHISLQSTTKGNVIRWFCILAVVPMVFAIAQTGSLSGSILLVVALLTFFLGKPTGGTRTKIFLSSLFILGIAIIVYISSPVLKERWQIVVDTGETSRDSVFSSAWELFMKRPLTGWGMVGNLRQVALQLPGLYDHEIFNTHSLLLHILSEVGIIGGIPFFIGVWWWLRAALISRHGESGGLSLAMSIPLLLGYDLILEKLFWFVVVYACAHGNYTPRS